MINKADWDLIIKRAWDDDRPASAAPAVLADKAKVLILDLARQGWRRR